MFGSIFPGREVTQINIELVIEVDIYRDFGQHLTEAAQSLLDIDTLVGLMSKDL